MRMFVLLLLVVIAVSCQAFQLPESITSIFSKKVEAKGLTSTTTSTTSTATATVAKEVSPYSAITKRIVKQQQMQMVESLPKMASSIAAAASTSSSAKQVEVAERKAMTTESEFYNFYNSGWAELQMRTKPNCEGKRSSVQGVRLGCSERDIPSMDGPPMTGVVTISAQKTPDYVKLMTASHPGYDCDPNSFYNHANMQFPRCSGRMTSRVINDDSKSFTRYQGMVKLGYGSFNKCFVDEPNPFTYNTILTNVCNRMEGPNGQEPETKMSYKFTGCSVTMNGPQMNFEVYKGYKCKPEQGKASGLLYTDTMNFRTIFNVTSMAPSTACTPSSMFDIMGANVFKYGCVNEMGLQMMPNY